MFSARSKSPASKDYELINFGIPLTWKLGCGHSCHKLKRIYEMTFPSMPVYEMITCAGSMRFIKCLLQHSSKMGTLVWNQQKECIK